MDRYKEIKMRLCSLAEKDEKIKALISFGSSAGVDLRADEYSDLDIIIVTDEPEAWIYGEYPASLGNIKISFTEDTFTGTKERRILYEGSYDLDMIVVTTEQFLTAVDSGLFNLVMNRGYSVLYDSMGIADILKKSINLIISHALLSEDEFNNMINDFLFHVIWALKKIQRGELWTAKMCIDSYMKGPLLKIIEMYTITVYKADVWHDGRFLDKWAEDEITEKLKSCFAHYDRDDMIFALISSYELFSRLAKLCAGYCKYSYPYEADIYVDELLRNSSQC